jgi:pimeloyl-ACP methyl ester carboxylesterase
MTKVLVQTGVELKYHTIGSPDDPAVVLIAGFGAQLLSWHDRLCRLLVDKGRLVIRFDNRDCGLSTKLDDHPVDLGAIVAAASNGDLAAVRAIVPYTLHDVADDVVGLLDELDIQRAHVVDASMGGMVAQLVAIHHSERTGEAENGQSTPDATAALLGSPPTDQSTYVSVAIAAARVWGSSRYFDPDAAADVAAASFDRCYSPQGTAQQIGALLATGSLADHLRGAGRRPLGHRARLGRRPDPHRGVGHGLCGPRRPKPEVVNSAAGMVIFPLTFVANTFVRPTTFPTPLRIFAEWNPISAVTQAARELFGNIPPAAPEPGAWALQHGVLYTLIWVVAIIAIFAPLAIRKYTTTGSTR